MGYHFKMNFNHPYLANSLKDFWQRWHISLSTWFRDYVYIPLGGNRKGVTKSILFMAITMILSGLWHGAAITFIIWGAIHAFFLSFERIVSPLLKYIPKPFIYLITMIFVLIGWVYFRGQSLSEANQIISNLFSSNSINIYWDDFQNPFIFLFVAIGFEIYYFLSKKNKIFNQFSGNWIVQSFEIALFISSCLFLRGPQQEFIYFQF